MEIGDARLTRLRLVGWQVASVIMSDDGEDLSPVQVQPQVIPARDWQAFKEGGDEAALEQIRRQAGEPAPAAP